MIMNTDTLAGEVRSTEASGLLSPLLLDWFQDKCRQTLIPATKGGINPEEHYLWFSRLLQTRGWLNAHLHRDLTLLGWEVEPPQEDQGVVFQDWEAWRAGARVLKPHEEERGWSAPLYRLSGDQVLNLQYNQGGLEPHFKPSRGACEAHVRFNRTAAWMISGALVGTGLLSSLGEQGSWGGTIHNKRKRSWGMTLTPEQAKAMAWLELMIALIKTGAEYWDDYFNPLGRALKVLMPEALDSGFTFRPPEDSSYRGDGRAPGSPWDQPWAQIVHPLTANSDTHTLKIAAISDFLTRNVDVFLDYIHQEAGRPPLTPLQRDESWRAALCGWTTSRGAPPFYGPKYCTERPKGGQPREAPTPLFCDFLKEDHNLYRYAE
jgi:hypothetical protein